MEMRLLFFRRFAVIALVVLSLFTTISHLIQDILVLDLSLRADNPYSHWDEMMQNVKKKLPMKSGIVGYFADWDIPGANYSSTDQRAEWFLTQYVG